MDFSVPEGRYYCSLDTRCQSEISYRMGFDVSYETQLKLEIEITDEADYYHVIPCNIFGNNHADRVKPGEFPQLTNDHPELAYCSAYWEFRADRAAAPLSALCCQKGTVAVSIDPYSGPIRNGVFSALPNRFGVTLGYTNLPVTAVSKQNPQPSTWNRATKAEASGTIYAYEGHGRLDLHAIIRKEYEQRSQRAPYRKSYREAILGMADAFARFNWCREEQEYCNRECHIPADPVMKPWRMVTEIGWTGGMALAYPLIAGRFLVHYPEDLFEEARSGEEITEEIVSGYNESSGLLYDLAKPSHGSRVNGWWAGYLVKDCHCAYTVGSAVHGILKSILLLQNQTGTYPSHWLEICRKVMDTVISLQREDGSYGYTYSETEKKVLDWEGFAGCWFAPCAAYLYHLTGELKYLKSAQKALRFYS